MFNYPDGFLDWMKNQSSSTLKKIRIYSCRIFLKWAKQWCKSKEASEEILEWLGISTSTFRKMKLLRLPEPLKNLFVYHMTSHTALISDSLNH